jgi:predicted RNA methylase
MTYIFYATFIPGLRECAAEIIHERLSDAVIHRLLDGAVIFETALSYDKLNFFCFNNIFALISVVDRREAPGALEAHVRAAISGGTSRKAEQIIARNSGNIRSFRIVISEENRPAAIDEKLRAEAERYIARVSGLGVNRSGPDTEFWFLYRREGGPPEANGRLPAGFSVFMKRLTLRPSWEKSLHPGELPPPLAWMLCRLGRLRHTDTVLDPFCGYGSIPFAALKHFHIKQFIACDHDQKAAAHAAARFKSRAPGSFILHTADFRSLLSLVPEKTVDVIITDPPWGLYRELPDGNFYEEMFRVFGALLKEGGRVLVLCAKEDELLEAAVGRLKLGKRVPILLSGRKTAIFQFDFT